MTDIVFWGATGQAKVLYEAILETGVNLRAVVDNRKLVSPLKSVPILHGKREFREWKNSHGRKDIMHYAIAIGGSNGAARIEFMEVFEESGLLPYTIIHRTAFVAKDASIGRACQILAHASVCSHARLSSVVIINTGASVDHDTTVGSGAHIAPGAVVSGEVCIGDRAFIGAGAVVLPRLRIGSDACIGAGSVVTRDVPPGLTVVGNPARELLK